MRLSTEYKNSIIRNFKIYFKINTQLFLYGSRTDVNKKGGDIDLLIITDSVNDKSIALDMKLDFIIKIKQEIGEQKIDCIILSKNELASNAFYQVIKDETILLCQTLTTKSILD